MRPQFLLDVTLLLPKNSIILDVGRVLVFTVLALKFLGYVVIMLGMNLESYKALLEKYEH